MPTQRFALDGKMALVTGASGVIGAALAEALAEAGADLVLVHGTRHDVAAELARTVRDRYGVQVWTAGVDMADRQAVAAHAARLSVEVGGLDVLVNCAGGNVAGSMVPPETAFFDLEPATLDAFDDVVRLNFLGACVAACRYYGALMRGREASIINISSMNAYRPLAGRPAYAAAKAAVSNFTQWLAARLAREGERIRVNAIAPGFIPNDRTRASLLHSDGSYAPRGQAIVDHTPLGRLSVPDDLAGTCLWYASDASRFVTGTTTPVDGGFTAWAGV